MTKPKRKTDQPDPGCLWPLVFLGAVVFGGLLAYEVFVWVERGM